MTNGIMTKAFIQSSSLPFKNPNKELFGRLLNNSKYIPKTNCNETYSNYNPQSLLSNTKKSFGNALPDCD